MMQQQQQLLSLATKGSGNRCLTELDFCRVHSLWLELSVRTSDTGAEPGLEDALSRN
ncbi:hypothetical protein LINPERHAP1_LOCUS32245 [Linum perenne]